MQPLPFSALDHCVRLRGPCRITPAHPHRNGLLQAFVCVSEGFEGALCTKDKRYKMKFWQMATQHHTRIWVAGKSHCSCEHAIC